MKSSPDSEISVRITVRRPPPGVTFAVQRGRTDLLEATARSADAVVFDFSLRVATASAGSAPRLLGPFVQGPPTGRFVYVNSGTRAGQSLSPWSRRAKVPLTGISTSMIAAALRTPGARMETEFEGSDKDGGPTCATVKSIIWRVV